MEAGGVSAIIVNWNGARDLEIALPSLLEQTQPLREIIVVDNGSSDDSAAVVDRFAVTWLPLHANRGIAAALNEGARAASGDILLFLNQDMRFPPNFVAQMSTTLNGHPQAFAVDATQLDWDEVPVHRLTVLERTNFAKGDLPGWLFGQTDAKEPAPCLYASAANAMIRRDRFEAVGGWDEGYPASWEDVDLALRARTRGWPPVFDPDAVCLHRVSATMGSTEGRTARVMGTLTGRVRFSLKFAPWPTATLTVALMLAALGADVARGRFALAGARCHALARAARDLPEIVRARRAFARECGGISAFWRGLVADVHTPIR